MMGHDPDYVAAQARLREGRSARLKIFAETKFAVDGIKSTTIVEYTNTDYK